MKKLFSANKLLFREAFQCMLFAFMVLSIISLIGVNLSFFSPFKNAFKEFSYLDMYYSEKLKTSKTHVSNDIVLVNIGHHNRKEISVLLQKIQDQRPKVIGLDVIFKEKKDPILDNFLGKQLKAKNIVGTYAFLENRIDTNHEGLSYSDAASGYSNFGFEEESTVIRNFQGTRGKENEKLISFPVLMAKKFLGENWKFEIEPKINTEQPINYLGGKDAFLSFDLNEVMEMDSIPIMTEKIVLLGYLGHTGNGNYDIEDKHFTPMNEKFVGKSVPDTFGVIIHANIVNMLVRNNFVKIVPKWVSVLVTIVLTFFALAYFIWLNKRQLPTYIFRINMVQLIFIIFFVWFSLLLYKNNILFKTSSITAVVVLSIGLIGFYKKLIYYFNKKFSWKTYFFQD